MAKASIITIGDELLIGQVIDTNSAWIAKELNSIGIQVTRRVAVGDDWDEIWKALDEESLHADIILITGGLGPTADDITKPLLCKYFNGKMIVDKKAFENVENIFKNILKRPMIERNAKQAEVPDTCVVIINKRGTAPGMIFNKDSKIFISMPGVPHEMKGMITDDVLPLLQKKYTTSAIVHRTLLTAGVGESFLAELIKDFEEVLPKNIKLAYLPNYGMVRLRLTATGEEKEQTTIEVDQQFDTLQKLVSKHLVTNEDEPLEKVVGKLLLAKKKTMCTAESCTGGYIAHLLTSISGSSNFYEGSIVSYSYQAKENLLNVERSTLEKNGAVSEEVVIEMVKGALQNIKADYSVAVSGIMGPSGGSTDKPVGTVWIAVGNKEKIETELFNFRFDRERNIQLTAVNALNLLRKFIIKN
ncbi:MAG: competence/damage-inducible protein A [Bacteroidota bacterium]